MLSAKASAEMAAARRRESFLDLLEHRNSASGEGDEPPRAVYGLQR